MRKALILLALSIFILPVFTLPVLAGGSYFSDVSEMHANFKAIQNLKESNIVNGYSDGTFKPNNLINRAELLTLVTNMKGGLSLSDAQKKEYENCFKDVNAEWYAHAVCNAKKQGWVDGYPDGTFKPDQSTNRAEAIKIVVNAFYYDSGEKPEITMVERQLNNLPTNLDENAWYYDFVTFAFRKNILDSEGKTFQSDGTFSYKVVDSITRKEVAEMIYRLITLHNNFITNYKSDISGDWVYKEDKSFNGNPVEDYVSMNLLVVDGKVTGTFFAGLSNTTQGTLYMDSGNINAKYAIGDKYYIDGNWTGDRNDYGTFTLEYDPISNTLLWETQKVSWDGLYTLPQYMRLEKEAL